jgi:hypothetical protein
MTNENMKNEELIFLAFDKKIKLHIVLESGDWRNGFVKEIKADFFLFDDTINGVEPIFYLQLKKVEPFMEDGE